MRHRRADKGQGIAHSAQHLGRAAEGIGVLHPGRGIDQLAAAEQTAHVGRAHLLATMVAHRVEPGIKGTRHRLCRLQAHGHGELGVPDQILGIDQGQTGQRRRDRRAVVEGQSLLGRQPDRLQARLSHRLERGQTFALVAGLALADERQGQVREGGQIAAGTHRSLLGDQRVHAPIQHLHQGL